MTDLTNVKLSADWLTDTTEMLESRGEAPEIQISRLPELNQKLWGIQRKKMYIFGARPSNGKTLTVLNLALSIAEGGHKVYFVSLEQPAIKLQERLFCIHQRVSNMDLLRGGLRKDSDIRAKWNEFCKAKFHNNLIISDLLGKDFREIDTVLAKMGRTPDVLIVDHIQEVRGTGDQKSITDRYLDGMRVSAIRNNYALILCSQVNRASQDEGKREPQLIHLKQSGSIEEQADVVALCHFNYHYTNKDGEKNQYQIHIAKNRDGMTGYIRLQIIPEYYLLSDWKGIDDGDAKTIDREIRAIPSRSPEGDADTKDVWWNN
jgi:replicative DNA helicase